MQGFLVAEQFPGVLNTGHPGGAKGQDNPRIV